jgi:MFS family permease
MSLLLSTLETTIVSTSLVSIVDDLHGFDRSGWLVTSYLLTYTGIDALRLVFNEGQLIDRVSSQAF